jgi:hypothetical protein
MYNEPKVLESHGTERNKPRQTLFFRHSAGEETRLKLNTHTFSSVSSPLSLQLYPMLFQGPTPK